jgi:hypothetical protein
MQVGYRWLTPFDPICDFLALFFCEQYPQIAEVAQIVEHCAEDAGVARATRAIGTNFMLTKLILWLRQKFCSHCCFLEDLERVSEDKVICPCNKCGKVLSAEYGLALPVTWQRRAEKI